MARLIRGFVIRRALRLRGSSFAIRKRSAKVSKPNPKKPKTRDNALKRALQVKDSSSTIRKKPWNSKMKKLTKEQQKKRKKQRAKRESFVCGVCLQVIARDRHLLTTVLRQPYYAIFRKVFKVNPVDNPIEYPEYGNYFRYIYCRQCRGIHLGSQILHISQPATFEYGLYGQHWVPGNYFMMIFKLLIRRGSRLLNAITREVVDYQQWRAALEAAV